MTIRIEHIVKTFGRLRANDDITLTFQEGVIYAILGENGAGKSTLMKILSGYQPADSGNINIDDAQVTFDSPASALRFGIGMLHQDPLDVSVLTVLENFMLGRPDGLLPDRVEVRKALDTHSARLGFSLNPDSYVDSLTIGERQQLEIVRLLSFGARVLILDEPTTGISTEQKNMLFSSLRKLARDEKLTVILVSHKLEDVEVLCDAVVVLRQGKLVGERQMPCPTKDMVAMMFGQELARPERHRAMSRDILLRASNLGITGRRLKVHSVNVEVHGAEVIGLAGLDGSGQSEFLRALAGVQIPAAGFIQFEGQDITRRGYHDRVGMGIAFAPAGRLEEGLVNSLTLAEHFALTMPTGMWIDWPEINKHTEQQIDQYHIKGRPASQIQTLSGGNQQRTLIALLPLTLKLLLLEEPTRGLDVESTRWVWNQLLARRQQGTAILFTSPDLEEIIEYSDRIMVFFGGRVTVVNDPAAMNVTQLGSLIGGKS